MSRESLSLFALLSVAALACAPPRTNPNDPRNADAVPNRPPTLQPVAPRALAEGKTLVLAVAAGDPDGDVVTLHAKDLPRNAVLDGAVLRFSPDYAQAGTFTFTLWASDAAHPQGGEPVLVELTVVDAPSGACLDQDGDGYYAYDVDGCHSGDDCHDGDATVHPGAVELTCDGLDNDCDPATLDDPDPTDADGDLATAGCGDCNDGDASISPSAQEVICDGIDNDCDAATSDNPDGDGDLFGICVDCEDIDPLSHPRAEERCGDGIDNNCDGGIDEGC